MSAADLPSCTCPLGGPFVTICPTHYVALDDNVAFDASDLPTLRKMAAVYTKAAEEETDPEVLLVHRIVSQVTTRLVAAMAAKADQ